MGNNIDRCHPVVSGRINAENRVVFDLRPRSLRHSLFDASLYYTAYWGSTRQMTKVLYSIHINYN